MTEKLLEVKELKKHFPVYAGIFKHEVNRIKAVDGISFSIERGKIVGLVGESGCGKSTASRTIMRLIEPTEGEIFFLNHPFHNLSKAELQPLRREIQMVFQDPYASLNPRKTVAETIGEALVFHKLAQTNNDCNTLIAETLQQVGLAPEMASRYPHEFSGGQQQRICIGRALALRPQLLILDEPVSALDVSIQAQILNLLIELKKKHSLSYLFISHDLSVVRYLCDYILVMYQGKIVEEGETNNLFSNPQHTYTQQLLSSIPLEHPRERN